VSVCVSLLLNVCVLASCSKFVVVTVFSSVHSLEVGMSEPMVSVSTVENAKLN